MWGIQRGLIMGFLDFLVSLWLGQPDQRQYRIVMFRVGGSWCMACLMGGLTTVVMKNNRVTVSFFRDELKNRSSLPPQ